MNLMHSDCEILCKFSVDCIKVIIKILKVTNETLTLEVFYGKG